MSVFRGVVIIPIMLKDEYGNRVPGQRRLETRTYDTPGIAKGQATTLANRYKNVLDKFVEEAVEWKRLD